ncbi:ankyrin repeat domain-containing protein [Phenylobacterium sp.]|uniref:ankyrin repeat domain-containing protein n=1 Tax=Phenylobacterium sp. TaxID=1871053 RepID=UPI002C6144BF|nr:ankyrin repeat domain-containing protein [Phenylobacterium sp.]HLZ75778.1 ankyrin repeat domain-containing protein [Phenylobacterium sp.]
MTGEPPLRALMWAIDENQDAAVAAMLAADPGLARAQIETGATRAEAKAWMLPTIGHYIYRGDSALHIAAAGWRVEIARRLLALGADSQARNRRGATALHYAADGTPGAPTWNPAAQARVVTLLIEAGADPNAADMNGVTPLHRAIRTRCAAAVAALLAGGADPLKPNGKGSTPLQLASWQTGRGGSGSPAAKAQQAEILRRLAAPGDSVR